VKTLSIAGALTKNWIRSRTGVFFSFLFPVILLLVFGSVFGGGDQTYNIWVQNLDLENGHPSELSSAFVRALENSGIFSVGNIPASAEISSWVKKNLPPFTSYRVIVIPENFGRLAIGRGMQVRTGVILSTLDLVVRDYGEFLTENELSAIENGRLALESWRRVLPSENASILLLTQEGDPAAPIVRSAVSSIVQAFNNSLVGAEPAVQVEQASFSERALRPADYYMPGYIAAFIMTNGVIGTSSTISEFRRSGILRRMAATPLSKRSWILANLLVQALLALALMVVMLLLGRLIFGTAGIPNIYFVLLILLGAVVFCTIGITIGCLLRDAEAATAAGNLIAFPMMFLSGAFWPVDIMPGFLQTVARCMPLYYFHQGLRELLLSGEFGRAAGAFAVLGALSCVFIFLAVKLTKWKEI